MSYLEFIEKLLSAVTSLHSTQFVNFQAKIGFAANYARQAGILNDDPKDLLSENPIVKAVLFLSRPHVGEPGGILRELHHIETAWKYFEEKTVGKSITLWVDGTGNLLTVPDGESRIRISARLTPKPE